MFNFEDLFLRRTTPKYVDILQNRFSLKFCNGHRKTPVLESLFNKKDTPTQVFSCEYSKIYKSNFYIEHLWSSLAEVYLEKFFHGNIYIKYLVKVY